MEPNIEKTKFGMIKIAGEKYDHDVLVRWDGKVRKRKSKLSKHVYGTSHKISLDEAQYIYKKKAKLLIIGTGQFDRVRLSDEARRYFEKQGVRVVLAATPEAVRLWNKAEGKVIGLFHVTC
ncbi:MAG: MTH938/NDUFAF3 family protein [Chloroflexota bacterium]|nr:MTH938/NDUFAF3 family protein [Chloroflexota bacterium]